MVQTILVFSANPAGTARLDLGRELREIKAALRRSELRGRFRLEQIEAVRPADLRRALLDERPAFVHFCGHADQGGIQLEDDHGEVKEVSGEALVELFRLFAKDIRCVLLNACWSEHQAQAIAAHIPYVIGMNQPISDRAAVDFAIGFFDALGSGEDVQVAYRFGCNSIRLEGGAEYEAPVLLQGAAAAQQPKTTGGGIGDNYYLLCDRDTQYSDFRAHFSRANRKYPGRPQFYLLHGEAGECHASFVQRLCDSRIRKHAEELFGARRANVAQVQRIPWSRRGGEAAERDLNGYLLTELEKQNGLNWDCDDLSGTLEQLMCYYAKDSVLVLSHHLSAPHWNADSQALLQSYCAAGQAAYQRILELEKDGHAALCLVFVNIVYPDASGLRDLPWLKRIRYSKKSIAARLAAPPAECRCRVMEELTAVTWEQADNHLAPLVKLEGERHTHLKKIFGNSRLAPMQEVELAVKQLADHLQEQEL